VEASPSSLRKWGLYRDIFVVQPVRSRETSQDQGRGPATAGPRELQTRWSPFPIFDIFSVWKSRPIVVLARRALQTRLKARSAARCSIGVSGGKDRSRNQGQKNRELRTKHPTQTRVARKREARSCKARMGKRRRGRVTRWGKKRTKPTPKAADREGSGETLLNAQELGGFWEERRSLSP